MRLEPAALFLSSHSALLSPIVSNPTLYFFAMLATFQVVFQSVGTCHSLHSLQVVAIAATGRLKCLLVARCSLLVLEILRDEPRSVVLSVSDNLSYICELFADTFEVVAIGNFT